MPDIICVLGDALRRINTRRDWEHARTQGEWRRSGLGQLERRDGSGWLFSTMSMMIVIWQRADGSWGAWTGDCGDAPDPEDEGFTLNTTTCSRFEITDDRAKVEAVASLRNSLVSHAATYLRDASIIDERAREHQL